MEHFHSIIKLVNVKIIEGSKIDAELIYYKTWSLSQQGQLTIIDYLRSPIGRE